MAGHLVYSRRKRRESGRDNPHQGEDPDCTNEIGLATDQRLTTLEGIGTGRRKRRRRASRILSRRSARVCAISHFSKTNSRGCYRNGPIEFWIIRAARL